MARRGALVVLLVALAAAPAGADTIVEKKHSVDAKIASLGDRVASVRQREAAVRREIASASQRIRTLEAKVGDVSAKLGPLERELGLRQLKIKRLNALLRLQQERLRLLQKQHAAALNRLGRRLVGLYEEGEPDTLSVLLAAESFTDFLDTIDYLKRIAREDKQIAEDVARTELRVLHQHKRARLTRLHYKQEARVLAVRVAQVRELRDRLLASRNALAGTRAAKQQGLAALTREERAERDEIESLQAVSAVLAEKIRAAQSADSDTAPSAAGLIWPVEGPVTSPFGVRWGRMHTGIDIAAPEGTPIKAAAAGTVIYASWMRGYGNLTVIDHGGGLATAYAHQSRLATSVGQSVAQGEVIGYVGSTGHSTGPHLHFEVRVNGEPVDPLGYLG